MKKMMLAFVAVLMAFTGFAQTQTDENTTATPQSEWLQTFSSIEISGPMDVVLVAVSGEQAPKISWDTKGAYTSKFRYQVKDRVLRLSERTDPRRPERTTVTIYYNTLQELRVDDARVTCQDALRSDLFDLYVEGQASLEAELDVKDLKMELSGQSTAKLSGTARYMTLTATSGTVSAEALEVMSATVESRSSASVRINVSERIDARTSMKGTITFKGKPSIVRGAGVRFMGGSIVGIE